MKKRVVLFLTLVAGSALAVTFVAGVPPFSERHIKEDKLEARTLSPNPFKDDETIFSQGLDLYRQNCSACHGLDMTGGNSTDISSIDMTDSALFELLYNGLPDEGMPPFATLGSTNLWKLVTFIQCYKKH